MATSESDGKQAVFGLSPAGGVDVVESDPEAPVFCFVFSFSSSGGVEEAGSDPEVPGGEAATTFTTSDESHAQPSSALEHVLDFAMQVWPQALPLRHTRQHVFLVMLICPHGHVSFIAESLHILVLVA
jgi:hypothetical protein